eukprot:15446433-Alexandrium_andersonii.AAC.1
MGLGHVGTGNQPDTAKHLAEWTKLDAVVANAVEFDWKCQGAVCKGQQQSNLFGREEGVGGSLGHACATNAPASDKHST